MSYKPEVGDVLNFSWNGLYGNLIKFHNFLTHGFKKQYKWTHTAIVGGIENEKIIVYEAIKTGFTRKIYSVEELNTYIKNGNMIVGRAKKPLTDVKQYCEYYEGTPYGVFDIISIALYTLFGKLAFIISTDAKQLICSEAVARILYDASDKQINFETEFKKRYDLITPIDLYISKQIKWLEN